MSEIDEQFFDKLAGTRPSRRRFIGFCGMVALLSVIPRKVAAAVGSPIDALRKIIKKRRDMVRLDMGQLAEELLSRYQIDTRPASFSIPSEWISVEQKDGQVYVAVRDQVYPDLDSVPEFTDLNGLEFLDGTFISDANGNAQLDRGDYGYSSAIEDIQVRFGATPGDLADRIPAGSQKPWNQHLKANVRRMQTTMPTLPQQESYPLEYTAQLFGTAWMLAGDGAAMTRKDVNHRLSRFLAHLRAERGLRDQLEDLRFYGSDAGAIRHAAQVQAGLIKSIEDLRDTQILPLIEELAEFVGGA